MMVIEAIKAADILLSQGILARIIDMFTIKPIDVDCIVKCAKETGAFVTVENSNIIGGLGSAVAETLIETFPTPLERVGVKDQFGEVGQQDELKEKFGLTAPHIVEAVKRVLARKRSR
jgi:transketolase